VLNVILNCVVVLSVLKLSAVMLSCYICVALANVMNIHRIMKHLNVVVYNAQIRNR
jgi:hypothetical protein